MEKETGVKLEIIYYTDPLCCWSWAFEPQWRRLVYEFRDIVRYRFCMGGLLPDWNNYHDAVNSVARPQQMGPVWMHARELSGMPINYNVWMVDPPSSSYPACVAVKCATLQSAMAGERYLRMVREAVMMKGKNISKKEVLLDIGQQLQRKDNTFNCDRLMADIGKDSCLDAFRKDIAEVKTRNISRFPSLIIKNGENKAILIDGYRPYAVLLHALARLNVKSPDEVINVEEYKKYWGSLTERELSELNA